MRIVNSAKKENFLNKINNIDWSDIYQSTDTQLAYSKFSDTFAKIYNECFPIRVVSTNYRNRLPRALFFSNSEIGQGL